MMVARFISSRVSVKHTAAARVVTLWARVLVMSNTKMVAPIALRPTGMNCGTVSVGMVVTSAHRMEHEAQVVDLNFVPAQARRALPVGRLVVITTRPMNSTT
jgi:hypothetical protein